MILRRQFVIALVMLVFVLVSPFIVCAAMPEAKTAAHPCCPNQPSSDASSELLDCGCISTQPTIPAANGDQWQLDDGLLLADWAPVMSEPAPGEMPVFAIAPTSPPPYISSHQLLL